MTITDENPRFEQLRQQLEASYEFHTEQLAQLIALRNDPGDAVTNASLAARSRQAIADIAAALRDMAEGRYGVCESCHHTIPAERLEIRPDARFCVTCRAEQ